MLYRLILSASLIALLVSECTSQNSDKHAEVTFEQLSSNSSGYNGKNVALEGFIFLGFETMVISEELKYSGYAEGHLIPGDRMIWIEGGIPPDLYDELYEQNMMGPSERYGKIMVKGIFKYGGQYGHLGAFE